MWAYILTGIVLLFVAGLLLSRVLRYAIIQLIETIDRKILGVDIHLEDLRLNCCLGRIEVDVLTIANPDGYSTKYLLEAKEVVFDVDMCNLLLSFGRHLIIQQIHLFDVDVMFDKGWSTSNVSAVLAHLDGDSQDKDKARNNCSFLSCLLGRDKPDDRIAESSPLAGGARSLSSHGADDARGQKERGLSSMLKPQRVTVEKVTVRHVGLKMAPRLLRGYGLRVALADVEVDNFSDGMREFQGGPALAVFIVRTLLKSALETVSDIGQVTGDLVWHSAEEFRQTVGTAGKTVKMHTRSDQLHISESPACC